MEFIQNTSLSDAGNVASIIGFLLTVVVFFNLRSIKRFYVFKARAPELLERLIEQSSKIALYQNDFSNSFQEIDVEVARVEITLKSLKQKLRGSVKASTGRVLKQLEKYNKQSKSSENLWHLYVDLQKLIAEVRELQSDLKWER